MRKRRMTECQNAQRGILKISEKESSQIMESISRIVAHGNILLQTGRVISKDDLNRRIKEVLTYEF